MQRYLMDSCYCYHCRKQVCNEKIKGARVASPIEPGTPSPMYPKGTEQKKLDEICQSCPNGLFEIDSSEKPKCPVCHEELWNIDNTKIEEVTLKGGATPLLIYHFRCPGCGKNLYNDINLWV